MPLSLLVAIVLPVTARHSACQAVGQLRPEHRRQLADLRSGIDEAIDKGVDWLLRAQLRDGSWAFDDRTFPTGQTAFVVYTLLKSGLLPSHPAIQRGIANIKTHRPRMVYVAGCHLLALAATRDPIHRDHMTRIVGDLLAGQEGSWSYPNKNGRNKYLHTDVDLSLTQFAALGLRAALRSRIDVPRKALVEAFNGVLRYQERPRKVKARGGGGTSASTREIAGFRYRWVTRSKPTGSMTTAGIASATILAKALGKDLGKSRQRALRRLTDRALGWLDHHYTVAGNPADKKRWHLYYLYGLERVGSLLGTEYIGTHPWYLDGARLLLDLQQKDGRWNPNLPEPDTCFALLFLKRATAASTGKAAGPSPVIVAEDPESEIWMRAMGGRDGSSLKTWITRIAAVGGDSEEVREIRVAKIQYLLGDKVIAEFDGDPEKAWRGQAYAWKHSFEKPGTYHVRVRVHVVLKDAIGKVSETKIWVAKGFDYQVDHVLEPWMLKAATSHVRNLLGKTELRVKASSQRGRSAPERALDQRESTSWRCAPSDKAPTLTIRLAKAQRADTLWLTQANSRLRALGECDRITKVRVFLNKSKTAVEVALAGNELEPTYIPLGRTVRVKRIRIQVVERKSGKRFRGVAGFSEIGISHE